jgi:hypothetical protein
LRWIEVGEDFAEITFEQQRLGDDIETIDILACGKIVARIAPLAVFLTIERTQTQQQSFRPRQVELREQVEAINDFERVRGFMVFEILEGGAVGAEDPLAGPAHGACRQLDALAQLAAPQKIAVPLQQQRRPVRDFQNPQRFIGDAGFRFFVAVVLQVIEAVGNHLPVRRDFDHLLAVIVLRLQSGVRHRDGDERR